MHNLVSCVVSPLVHNLLPCSTLPPWYYAVACVSVYLCVYDELILSKNS